MRIFVAICGAVLALFLLRDIFHTVFNPRGTGSLGDFVARMTWRLFRLVARVRPKLLPFAGPISLLLVIAAWTASMVMAWGMIFWATMPADFVLDPELRRGPPGFADAVYVSFNTLITLGVQNSAPASRGLRMLIPIEGLIGFSLLTASISWVLGSYPVISRRRVLAGTLDQLHQGEKMTGRHVVALEVAFAAMSLSKLAYEISVARSDLVQFPITYYFQPANTNRDVPAWLPFVLQLSEEAMTSADVTVRVAGHALSQALADLLRTAAPFFGGDKKLSPGELIKCWRVDHLSERAPDNA
jgi:hypothetical protein